MSQDIDNDKFLCYAFDPARPPADTTGYYSAVLADGVTHYWIGTDGAELLVGDYILVDRLTGAIQAIKASNLAVAMKAIAASQSGTPMLPMQEVFVSPPFSQAPDFVLDAQNDPPADTLITLAYQQPSGVVGGQATANAWTPYPLNAVLQNDVNIPNLYSSSFILPAGTYIVLNSYFCFINTSWSAVRLFNVTTGRDLVDSVSDYAGPSTSLSLIPGIKFTLAASSVLRVDYYTLGSSASNDLGYGVAARGTVETYGFVCLKKIN